MAISDFLIGNARPGANPEYEARLYQFLKAMEERGTPLQIHSHFRDLKHQTKLFNDAVKRYGSPEAADDWVARPSPNAPHVKGIASDLSFNGTRLGRKGTEEATALAHSLAPQFGLDFRMDHEPWHVELAAKPSESTLAPGTSLVDNMLKNVGADAKTKALDPRHVNNPMAKPDQTQMASIAPPDDTSYDEIMQTYLARLAANTPAPSRKTTSEPAPLIKY